MYAEYAKAADIVSFDIYPTNAEEPEVKDKLWLPVSLQPSYRLIVFRFPPTTQEL